FSGVRKIAGLGSALRASCDGVIAKAPDAAALVSWRESLARWEQLAHEQQEVAVARGMRLVARFARPPAKPEKIDPKQSVAAILTKKPAPPTPTPTLTPTEDPLAAPTNTLPGIGPAFA